MEYHFSLHCKQRMFERDIKEDLVKQAIASPDQIIKTERREILHKRYKDKNKGNKEYLLRVFIEEKSIVSVYKTSRIEKYWRV